MAKQIKCLFLFFMMVLPFYSSAQGGASTDRQECNDLQEKANKGELTPGDAEPWLACNPMQDLPWPDYVPEGLNASNPPPALNQLPTGLFPTFNSEARS